MIRLCAECRRPVLIGYSVNDTDFFDSEDCMNKHYTGEQLQEIEESGSVFGEVYGFSLEGRFYSCGDYITWIDYKTEAGGKFVVTYITSDKLEKAFREFCGSGDMFEYLSELCETHVIEYGTDSFNEFANLFEQHPDWSGANVYTLLTMREYLNRKKGTE